MPNVMAAPKGGRIPALDGLRGIAILLVLLWHGIFEASSQSRLLSHLLLVGKLCWSGVDLFFVLSGFLIVGILLDAKESPRYFRTFYARRAFRILPLYAVVLGLCFTARYIPARGVAHWLTSIGFVPVAPVAFLTFSQNFWMAYVGKFSAGALSPTWSLAVEEQFYLTMPLIIKRLSRKRIVAVLATVVLCAPVLRTLIAILFTEHGCFADYVLMPCRADALALGALAAILVRNPTAWNAVVRRPLLLMAITTLMLACLAFLSLEGLAPFSVPLVTLGYSVLAVFYTCCLLIALSFKGGIAERVLTNRYLMSLGTVAYCAYLIHAPLITFGFNWVIRVAPNWSASIGARPNAIAKIFGALIGVTLTVALSSLSWHLLERPLLRIGHRYQYWERPVGGSGAESHSSGIISRSDSNTARDLRALEKLGTKVQINLGTKI